VVRAEGGNVAVLGQQSGEGLPRQMFEAHDLAGLALRSKNKLPNELGVDCTMSGHGDKPSFYLGSLSLSGVLPEEEYHR